MQIFGRETRLIMGKVKVANLSTCNLLLSSFIVLKTPTSDYEIILQSLVGVFKKKSQIHQFRKSLLTLNSQVSHCFPDYPSYTESMNSTLFWSITLLKQKLYFGALIIIYIIYYYLTWIHSKGSNSFGCTLALPPALPPWGLAMVSI